MHKRLINFVRHNIDPAIKIAVIYVFFGFLWIVFSDQLVDFFFDDIAVITRIQTIKGWFFVSMSGIIIYALVKSAFVQLKGTRESLNKAVIFHKTLFEEFPQPVYQMSPEGKITYINSKCKNQPGLNKSHILDNVWIKYVHKDDQANVLENYRKAILSEEPYQIELRLLQPDESYNWFLDNAAPYYSATGQIKGYIGSCININDKKIFEKQLKEALEMYSSLFINNPNPMLVFDNNSFEILEANNSAVELYGYTKDEFYDLSLKEIHPCEELISDDNTNQILFTANCKHVKKDRTKIDVKTYVNKRPVLKGRNASIMAIQNVTESKIAFDDLLESEQRFKVLFKSSPDISMILSKQFMILDANQSACGFFEKEMNKITGSSLFDLFENKLEGLFLKLFEEVDKNLFAQETIKELYIGNKEFSADVIGLCFMEKGNKRYYLSIKDITDKVVISKALEESERFLNTLISNLPGMVYRCKNDPHYTMEFVSEGSLKLTGYKPEQLIGNNDLSFGAIILSEDRIRIWEEVQQKIHSRMTVPLIYRIVTKNNETKWVLDQVKGVFNSDGEILFIEGFLSDITDEKNFQEKLSMQMQELSRINAELERFNYTVSHDLRSPLVTVKGFLELIRENMTEGNYDQIDEDLDRVIFATDKMHYLLEDLLKLSQIGRVSESFLSFPMDNIINEVIVMLQGIIKKNNVEIIVEKNMPEVIGEKNRIIELWQNLIENAIKFKADKNPIIQIGYEKDENNKTIFFVMDNGIGIEEKYHDKVFGLFNKLDPNTEGTGVGLAIAHRIIEIHGGKIWFESVGKNKGTKVMFYFET